MRVFSAGPTKGSPCRSLLKPGGWLTMRMLLGHGPAPGTACVRVAWSPQFLHDRMTSWSRISSVGALSDFHPGLGKGDVLARFRNRLQHRLELVIGEGNERKAERSHVETHRVQGRLDRNRVG